MTKAINKSKEVLPPWIKREVGRGTTEWVVRRSDCPAFDTYDLVEMGHFDAAPSYEVARANWPFIVVAVCVGGSGTISSDESVWRLDPGQALLLPPHIPQDWRATEAGWSCTTLNYRPEGFISDNASLPRLLSIHAKPLEAMIQAFRYEFQSDKDPAFLRQMLEIIQTKVVRLFNSSQNAGRLWPLWSAVLEHPDFNWTIDALSERGHLSGEHLRRLCLQEAKRSPMAQVTWLRLKAAASRLAVGNDVIEEIAHQVGFGSERAFRSAFTRNFQCSPSEYRQKNRQSFEALNIAPASLDAPGVKLPHPREPQAIANYHRAAGQGTPFFLRMDSVANAYFSVGPHPWFGDIPLKLPESGIKQIHGVPFLVLNEQKGPSFLLLRSSRLKKDCRNKALPDRVKLPLKKRARSIYFLHACGWGADYGAFARYRLIYADRTTAEQPLVVLANADAEETDGRQANIQDWYFSWDQLATIHAKPYDATPQSDASASSQYLYTLEWINPHPDKIVAALEIVSNPHCSASLALLSVTLFAQDEIPRPKKAKTAKPPVRRHV
jgi:AraC-like DNA-binding protein